MPLINSTRKFDEILEHLIRIEKLIKNMNKEKTTTKNKPSIKTKITPKAKKKTTTKEKSKNDNSN